MQATITSRVFRNRQSLNWLSVISAPIGAGQRAKTSTGLQMRLTSNEEGLCGWRCSWAFFERYGRGRPANVLITSLRGWAKRQSACIVIESMEVSTIESVLFPLCRCDPLLEQITSPEELVSLSELLFRVYRTLTRL